MIPTVRPGFRLLQTAVLIASMIGTTSVVAEELSLPQFVEVPAGLAVMGGAADEPGRRGDEEPRSTMMIARAFELATTEVRADLWFEVMGVSPSYFSACDACPVESITWFEALDFCNVLSARVGLDPVYEQIDGAIVWNGDADGFRLPTEAEWEYACRAGSPAAFHGGGCLTTDEANYDGTRPQTPCGRGLDRHEPLPVGSFTPNGWGLFDMHGNVAEWCWNGMWRYGTDPVPGPGSMEMGDLRSVRGGAWISLDTGCRSAVRFFIPPDSRYDFVGLRLARNVATRSP